MATATVPRSRPSLRHSVAALSDAQRGELLPHIVRVMLAASWRRERNEGYRRGWGCDPANTNRARS
jgi:hypothetical protein